MGTTGGKAYLEFVEIVNGRISSDRTLKRLEFHFNPEDLELRKAAAWKFEANSTKTKAPPVQYLGPKPAQMTLKMRLDDSKMGGSGDVSSRVQELVDACIPTEASTTNDRPLPPAVRFVWKKVHFEGYLEDVTAHYTLFAIDGTPLRAECTLTLREIGVEPAGQNPTSGTRSVSRVRQVITGDTLAGIAYQEYRDPTLWRVLARANGIDDPLRLTPGASLLIPSPAEAPVSRAP